MSLPFRYGRMLLHRPASFGKTTFLKELGQFCDVVRNDSNSNFRYFTPENTKSSYVAIHRANYLILHFDFDTLHPGASDTFTVAGFRDQLMSVIRGQLEKYISKYSEKGLLGLLPIDEPSQPSLMQMCHYIPRQSDYTTIITIDNYNAPFLNAPLGRLTDVEDVIAELFYGNVLAVFGGYGVMRPKLIIMGSGMRDYPAPAKRIVEWLSLVNCTRNPCYAKMVGLTTSEIKAGVRVLVEDEGIHLALFKEIENTCWRESFMEGSDVEVTVCSREVKNFLAVNVGDFHVYDSSAVAAVVAAIGRAQIFTWSGVVYNSSVVAAVVAAIVAQQAQARSKGAIGMTQMSPPVKNLSDYLFLSKFCPLSVLISFTTKIVAPQLPKNYFALLILIHPGPASNAAQKPNFPDGPTRHPTEDRAGRRQQLPRNNKLQSVPRSKGVPTKDGLTKLTVVWKLEVKMTSYVPSSKKRSEEPLPVDSEEKTRD
ncbi:hypothetical protein BT96DRAFT_1006177 [Gymnopus androsaceus JB14]|uniref:AAA-ATPase-like domain-containing protein n=1 Tax=Gymnopus androsaceus JB14 TaxID=1447944 RepID=A0A6A4GLX2_9AGAR|nr:hypothetical protein BT96DRAFT_1006177 [Gymnopus androsaceus JB14]